MAVQNSKNFDLEEAKKSAVLDAQGKTVTFGTILAQQDQTVTRTLVVFIRHFFCGVSKCVFCYIHN